MGDISILLNFSSKISFADSDPLMNLVVKESLLFYDRLSVVGISSVNQEEQVKENIRKLRNLLEARKISIADMGGGVRLIIAFDLVGGLFHPENKMVFPAQKARRFRRMMSEMFGEGNDLLNRIEYCFIFVGDDAPSNRQKNDFYKSLSYDGLTGAGYGDFGWIDSTAIKQLNELKTSMLKNMDGPDSEWKLREEPAIKEKFSAFEKCLEETKTSITQFLQKAGVSEKFEDEIVEYHDSIISVGDFRESKYGEEICACIRKLIGVNSGDLGENSTFFIVNVRKGNINNSKGDEFLIKSLIQLICTVDTTQYCSCFKPLPPNKGARLFVMGSNSVTGVRFDDLSQLYWKINNYTQRLTPIGEGEKVKYDCYSLPPNITPGKDDSYSEITKKIDEERKRIKTEYDEVKKIPFFFGKTVGDWNWYKAVVEKINSVYVFEQENGRPLYDIPFRITKEKMTQNTITAKYRELEQDLEREKNKHCDISHVDSINEYMDRRDDLLGLMADSITRIKKEMPKLGFWVCLFWMGVFSVIGSTICYACHFLGLFYSKSLISVAIAFVAIGMLFVLSSFIGQRTVKGRIRSAFRSFEVIYQQLQKNLDNYIEQVRNYVKQRNEADVRRLNIDEMESKIADFKRHNKCVELWKDYLKSIQKEIEFICDIFGQKTALENASAGADNIKFNPDDLKMLDCTIPAIPDQISNKYMKRNIVSFNNLKINNVTCFVDVMKATESTE